VSFELGLPGIILPLAGQARFRFQQDLEDRAAVLFAEFGEISRLVLAGEHFQQTVIHELLCRTGQAVERFRVNEIAAGILENPFPEIEVAERSSAGISRTT